MTEHEMLPEGESMAKWALNEPGFIGSVKQILNCARCGGIWGPKRRDDPLHVKQQPVLHFLCDDCYDALPD